MKSRTSANGVLKHQVTQNLDILQGWRDNWSSRTRDFYCYWFCPSRTFPWQPNITAKASISLTTILTLSVEMEIWWKVSQVRRLHTQACKNLTSWWFFMIQMTSTGWWDKGFFTESVRDRYNAYGWHTALVEDGTDLEAIHAAIEAAKGFRQTIFDWSEDCYWIRFSK